MVQLYKPDWFDPKQQAWAVKTICSRITSGESLSSITNRGDPDYPDAKTFRKWLKSNAKWREDYDEAMQDHASALIDMARDMVLGEGLLPADKKVRSEFLRDLASKVDPHHWGDVRRVEVTNTQVLDDKTLMIRIRELQRLLPNLTGRVPPRLDLDEPLTDGIESEG